VATTETPVQFVYERPESTEEREKNERKERKAAKRQGEMNAAAHQLGVDAERRKKQEATNHSDLSSEVHWRASRLADAYADDCQDKRRRYLVLSDHTNRDEALRYQQQALAAHKRSVEWRQIAKEICAVSVKHEPPPYGPNSPHSWFRDLMLVHGDTGYGSVEHRTDRDDAEARLRRHGRSVILAGVGGDRRCHGALRNIVRTDDQRRSEEEYRAITTGSGSAAAMVTPDYLLKDYALFRSFARSFAAQCSQQELPPWGTQIEIPVFGSPSSVAQQALETAGITELDPSASFNVATLDTFAGQVTISQALFDRSGPGVSADAAIFRQIRSQYDAAVDSAVIALALANVTPITNSSAFTLGNLYGDTAHAASLIESTPGTYLSASTLHLQPALWRFITAASDGQGRPLIVPDGAPHTEDTPPGYTGWNLAGLQTFENANIPSVSGHSQLIVANAKSVLVFESEPVMQVFPEPYAGSLSVVCRLYGYVTASVLYPNAIQSVTGACYPASPTFA